jgi:hypothetical protein
MDSLVACIEGQLGAQRPMIGGPFGPLGVHLPGAGPPIRTLLSPQSYLIRPVLAQGQEPVTVSVRA